VCGEEFINSSHYAIDCIRPKCVELQRICTEYSDIVKSRCNQLEKLRLVYDENKKVTFEYEIIEKISFVCLVQQFL
jgi:hypothetical protein